MGEAGLAFLGLGDSHGTSWGLILNRSLADPNLLYHYMWLGSYFPPGLAITWPCWASPCLDVGLEPKMNHRAGL